MLRFSIIGAVVTGVCCFTPVLVWITSALGIGWVIARIEPVLLTFFGFFIAMSIILAFRNWKRQTK